MKKAIATCLNSQLPQQRGTEQQIATALLYLRGRIETEETGESWLVLRDGVRLSRSWLRQILKNSTAVQQIVILDCPGDDSLGDWIEELKLESERGQCLIGANSLASLPKQFTEVLLETLNDADPQTGLPVAAWITQLQVALAGTGIIPQVWLSGTRGVIEVLPGKTEVLGADSGSFDIGVCPYMGLQAFKEDNAQYFYGRESLVQRLLNHIGHKSTMAVVGASGSGKSSVVQAGLLAQLRQGKQIPSSDRWWLGCFRPGDNPIEALARRLTDGGTKEQRIQQQLRIEGLLYQGVEGFVQWLRSRPEPVVLLVIDQFEELFTLTQVRDRLRFLELLLGAVKYAGDRFKLVLTVRADFIASCLEIPELAAILQQTSVLVPPYLTEEDYRSAIAKPAEQVGLQVESGLIQVLLQDLDRSAGDLPLLQFVLQQLWEKRSNGQLTLDAYKEMRGIKGALERQANSVYNSLDPKEKECAQWIFLNLTQLGEGTEDTRRRVTKSDLIVEKYPAELVERTLQTLTAAKLLVVNLDSGNNIGQSRSAETPPEDDELFLAAMQQDVTVEVIHEILIRHWSTLRWWLEENRARLRSQRQIEQAAVLWQQKNKQPDFLLQGVRLAEAEEIYVKYSDELTDLANEFVAVCLDAREAAQREAKRRLRKAQLTATALGILGLAATAFGVTAYRQKLITQLENVNNLNAISEAQLLSNQQLASLTTSLKAGKQLQGINGWQKLLVGTEDLYEKKTKTAATLQQSIYGTQTLNILEGHSQKVNAVAYSPDGLIMATASDDGTIKVWNNKGELINTLKAHKGQVTNLALEVNIRPQKNFVNWNIETNFDFNRTRYSLVSTGADGKALLWVINDNGENYPNAILLGQSTDWMTSVALSSNNKLAAFGDRNGNIYWESVNQYNQKQNISAAHNGWVNALSFSSDSQYLASGGEDGVVKIWQINQDQLQEIKTINTNLERVSDLEFSADGKSLVVAGGETVQSWQINDSKLINSYSHSSSVNSVALDDKLIATATADGKINLYQNGTLQQTLTGHTGEVTDLQFRSILNSRSDKSPDLTSKVLVSTGVDKTVRLWTISHNYFSTSPGISSVAISPQDSNIFAAADRNNQIKIWQNNSQLLQTLPGHQETITQIKYSPDGKIIASASWDKTIKLWDVENDKLITTLTGHQNAVNTIAFSPDGKTLISGGEDKTIKLWNLETDKLITTLTGHTDSIKTVTVSPDNKLIASAGYDNKIKIWTIAGELLQTIDGHNLAVTSLQFTTPLGSNHTLASASWDNSIKLWKIENEGKTSQLLHTLIGHQDGVTTISFNSNGTILASGSGDRNIKLWDVKTGELIKTLRGHTSQINTLAFSNDDNTIISGEEQKGLFWWNLDLNNLLTQGCDRISDYLATNPHVKSGDRNICRK
ncbi:MAG: caspase family protein [Pleurocapsa sp.]